MSQSNDLDPHAPQPQQVESSSFSSTSSTMSNTNSNRNTNTFRPPLLDLRSVFPLTKIRNGIRKEEDIGKMTSSAIEIVAACSAVFIQQLAEHAKHMANGGIVTSDHVRQAIQSDLESYDFLLMHHHDNDKKNDDCDSDDQDNNNDTDGDDDDDEMGRKYDRKKKKKPKTVVDNTILCELIEQKAPAFQKKTNTTIESEAIKSIKRASKKSSSATVHGVDGNPSNKRIKVEPNNDINTTTAIAAAEAAKAASSLTKAYSHQLGMELTRGDGACDNILQKTITDAIISNVQEEGLIADTDEYD